MFENYIDVIEASKVLDVHPETVKRLIREGKLTGTRFDKIKNLHDFLQAGGIE